MTQYSRDAVTEGGGVLLDEFACCAVTCSGTFGGLGHLPCALLAQPSSSQVLLKLLLAHQCPQRSLFTKGPQARRRQLCQRCAENLCLSW
jgi:hypothetical protein